MWPLEGTQHIKSLVVMCDTNNSLSDPIPSQIQGGIDDIDTLYKT